MILFILRNVHWYIFFFSISVKLSLEHKFKSLRYFFFEIGFEIDRLFAKYQIPILYTIIVSREIRFGEFNPKLIKKHTHTHTNIAIFYDVFFSFFFAPTEELENCSLHISSAMRVSSFSLFPPFCIVCVINVCIDLLATRSNDRAYIAPSMKIWGGLPRWILPRARAHVLLRGIKFAYNAARESGGPAEG